MPAVSKALTPEPCSTAIFTEETISPAMTDNKTSSQDSSVLLRIHLKRIRELFDQFEAADMSTGTFTLTRRERLMSDMDHE